MIFHEHVECTLMMLFVTFSCLLPLLEFLKQGDRACCPCDCIFHDLSDFSAQCEPDASDGVPQPTTNSPVRDAVVDPELQGYWCCFSFVLSPGSCGNAHV